MSRRGRWKRGDRRIGLLGWLVALIATFDAILTAVNSAVEGRPSSALVWAFGATVVFAGAILVENVKATGGR